MHDAGDWVLLAGTVMPDHVHLLFELGHRLPLSAVSGKMKHLTRSALASRGLRWQANFYEHRLRPDDVAGAFAFYIFLNPYRAGLISRLEAWPWWWRNPDVDFDFLAMLDKGRYPREEWLEWDLGAVGVRAEDVGETG